MPFKKGQSGNPGGRATNPARKALKEGLIELIPRLFEELAATQGEDFIDGWAKVAPYALPKLSNIEVGADKDKGGLRIEIVNATGPNTITKEVSPTTIIEG